jgi:hypothetical protein
MREAERQGVPFWPAASILDTPSIIMTWRSIKAEAEYLARPVMERRAAQRANSK